ncbi:MAG: hypothetical protein ACI4HN_10385, partial [Ruminococcus sp.]
MDKLKKILFEQALKIEQYEKEALDEYHDCFKTPKVVEITAECIKEKREEYLTLSAQSDILSNIMTYADLKEELKKKKSKRGLKK